MKKTLRSTCLIVLIAFSLSVSAQGQPHNAIATADSIVTFFHVVTQPPHEKLYIQTDKPYYNAGDKIWFRGYLLNASTHKDDTPTNYIYLELLDRSDSLVGRYKFHRDSLEGFRGSLPLPATLSPGDYSLRGYTSWMQNDDPDFFFSKNLYIGNSIVTDIVSEITQRPSAQNDNTLGIQFQLQNGAQCPPLIVDYILTIDNKSRNGRANLDRNGLLTIRNVQPSQRETRINLRVANDTLQYTNTLHLYPQADSSFAVSFFPEGGNLTAGIMQQVAFKAQSSSGFSIPVHGCVLSNRGDTISTLVSEFDGMGSFAFIPESGISYHAMMRSEQGREAQFDLPPVRDTSITLSMTQRGESIMYNVQKSPNAVWPDSLYLVAHVRGDLKLLILVPENKPTGRFSAQSFPDGIAHFILVGNDDKPLSERLIFIHHPQTVNLTAKTDKANYGTRQGVTLNVALADSSGVPVHGNFSMSVTNSRTVNVDSTADNIVSSLLLTSDLKGYIEHPAYYLSPSEDHQRPRRLDLVMLTHGWRRFDLNGLLRPTSAIAYPNNYIEVGQTVTGSVLNGFNKGVAGASVVVYSPDCFGMTESDPNGRFLIEGIRFSDTVSLMVQATTLKGKSNITIEVDPEHFPTKVHKAPFAPQLTPSIENYLKDARVNYFTEGGEKVYHLSAVTVIGQKPQSDMYKSMAELTVSSDQIPLFMQNQPIIKYLPTLSGVSILSGKLSIRQNPNEPLILIDEVPYTSTDVLTYLNMDQVASISVIKGANAAFFGIRGANGVISIVRKDGTAPIADAPAPGVVFVNRLGCHTPTEFYSPVYATPEQSHATANDTRSTIFWTPALSLNDSGTGSVAFYTSDDTAPYRVTIEGITDNGTPINYSEILVNK